ncbi:MAG: hypothetical protein NZ765_03050 [Anaerolineae bacterium]|nr:hypothetical protein [Anaerolineae bacterium]MDW8070282.1 hypothetical protein [Anaerolineae bacterium]
MREEAILKIDQAAIALLQALEAYGGELQSCLAAQELERVRTEVVNLRQTLLGLEMGILYQDWDSADEEVKRKLADVCREAIPISEAAARLKQDATGLADPKGTNT